MALCAESSSDPGIALPSRAFTFTGIAQLVGWNAVLTASAFLDSEIFPGRKWAFRTAIIYAVGTTIGQAVMIGGPLPRLPFSVRWCLSVVCMMSAMLGLFAMVALTQNGALAVDVGFDVALSCVILLSLGAAVFQASTFGLAGAADPALSGRLMMGQGIAGIVTGVASVFKPSLTVLGCLVGVTVLTSLLALVVYCAQLRVHPQIRSILERMAADRLLPSADAVSMQGSLGGGAMPQLASPRRRNRRIAQDVLSQAIGVFFIFLVTFVVFPGVVTRWSGALGLPATRFVTLMVGEFQLLDVAGRTAAGYVRAPRGKVVLASSLSRAAFVPLFIGAQIGGENSFFSNGVWEVVLMGLFAFSNGFVSTLGMMLGPERVCFKEEKETAGHIMSFSLASGILVGSLLALLTQVRF
uniref:Uncharacterized protein n=1 Tax=Pyrodinium bahamense TaxID=73915 RepID=A0A7S0FYT7_9DINO